MRDGSGLQARRLFLNLIFAAAAVLSAGMGGCGSSNPPQQPAEGPQRYHLTGRVVSVEPTKQQVVVDAADIPGFMSAMTMGYPVKNPNLLAPLSPEDQIKADVVVNGNDMYLENIVIVKKADHAKSPEAGDVHSAPALPANH
jgi:hypothetical protein